MFFVKKKGRLSTTVADTKRHRWQLAHWKYAFLACFDVFWIEIKCAKSI
jgi:hypothetical protein